MVTGSLRRISKDGSVTTNRIEIRMNLSVLLQTKVTFSESVTRTV